MPKRSKPRVEHIAETVATIRRVDSTRLFSPLRESEKVASARTFAMGACLAAGIPFAQVAQAFGREWRAVFNAEKSCERRRRNSNRFADEWKSVLATAQASRQPAEVAED